MNTTIKTLQDARAYIAAQLIRTTPQEVRMELLDLASEWEDKALLARVGGGVLARATTSSVAAYFWQQLDLIETDLLARDELPSLAPEGFRCSFTDRRDLLEGRFENGTTVHIHPGSPPKRTTGNPSGRFYVMRPRRGDVLPSDSPAGRVYQREAARQFFAGARFSGSFDQAGIFTVQKKSDEPGEYPASGTV